MMMQIGKNVCTDISYYILPLKSVKKPAKLSTTKASATEVVK